MLPDFPRTRKELDQLIQAEIKARAQQKAVIPTLAQSFTQHEGATHIFAQEGNGQIRSGYKAHTTEFQIPFADVPTLVGEKLNSKLDEIAEKMGKAMWEEFSRVMDETTEQTGNRFDAGGSPPTKELMLQMMERVPWGPSSCFIMHPLMAEQMKKLEKEWQEDKVFTRNLRDLESRKKEEWRARESNRKLVR